MTALSTADASIRTALHTALWAVAGVPGAGYRRIENVRFDPPSGQPWVSVLTRFDDVRGTGLGGSAGIPQRFHLTGAMLVDLYFKQNTNTAVADALVGTVTSAFAPGTSIPGTGVRVLIEGCSKSQQQDGDGWYFRPMVISWSCDVVQ